MLAALHYLVKPDWSRGQITTAACALALGADPTLARAAALDTSEWGQQRASEFLIDVGLFGLEEIVTDVVCQVLERRKTQGSSPD